LSNTATVKVTAAGSSWMVEDLGWRYILTSAGQNVQVQPYPQTSASANELAANPEHLNAAAYGVLAKEVYPWRLPFDLWAEAGRAYLGQLGVSRADLMRALSPSSSPDDLSAIAIATESLGMTSFERQIAAATTSIGVNVFWGIPSPPPATWVADLSHVRSFLLRSGLAYSELVDLFGTTYANPAGKINIQSTDPKDPLTCDTQKLQLTNLTADALDRAHR